MRYVINHMQNVGFDIPQCEKLINGTCKSNRKVDLIFPGLKSDFKYMNKLKIWV